MELPKIVRNIRDGEIFIFWSAFRLQHTGLPRADGILCGTDGNQGGSGPDFPVQVDALEGRYITRAAGIVCTCDQLHRASHSRNF